MKNMTSHDVTSVVETKNSEIKEVKTVSDCVDIDAHCDAAFGGNEKAIDASLEELMGQAYEEANKPEVKPEVKPEPEIEEKPVRKPKAKVETKPENKEEPKIDIKPEDFEEQKEITPLQDGRKLVSRVKSRLGNITEEAKNDPDFELMKNGDIIEYPTTQKKAEIAMIGVQVKAKKEKGEFSPIVCKAFLDDALYSEKVAQFVNNKEYYTQTIYKVKALREGKLVLTEARKSPTSSFIFNKNAGGRPQFAQVEVKKVKYIAANTGRVEIKETYTIL